MQVDLARLRMPAVSPHGLAVLDAVADEDVNVMQLAEQVARDPALSSSLLYLANSPLYRRHREVTNARLAVNMLGVKRVRMAVMVVAMREVGGVTSPAQDALWEHSFGIAALCRMLGQESFPLLVDDLEVTGLLHDLGALVLAGNYAPEYAEALARSTREQCILEEVELATFGLDRTTLTDHIAEQMHLPTVTRGALRLFHGDGAFDTLDTDEDKHAAVLALAHHVDAMAQGNAERAPMRVPGDFGRLQAALGIRTEEVEDIVEDYQALLNQAAVM